LFIFIFQFFSIPSKTLPCVTLNSLFKARNNLNFYGPGAVGTTNRVVVVVSGGAVGMIGVVSGGAVGMVGGAVGAPWIKYFQVIIFVNFN